MSLMNQANSNDMGGGDCDSFECNAIKADLRKERIQLKRHLIEAVKPTDLKCLDNNGEELRSRLLKKLTKLKEETVLGRQRWMPKKQAQQEKLKGTRWYR